MTWTRVQVSAAYAATGTGTLPGNVAVANLVVAAVHATTNTPFTAPPGWLTAPALGVGIAGSRTEIWYLPPQANPGGFSTAAFTVSGAGRCALAEYHTTVANPLVVLDSGGNATNAAGTADAITANANSSAGDLAVCAFLEHFAAGTAVVWTDPSGFTAIAEMTASNANQAYAADQLSASSGTLTATGTTASSGAWSGVLAVFNVSSLPPTPAPLIPVGAVMQAANW